MARDAKVFGTFLAMVFVMFNHFSINSKQRRVYFKALLFCAFTMTICVSSAFAQSNFYRISDIVSRRGTIAGRARADLSTGICTVLLEKPRQRDPISDERLNAILGQTGVIVNNEESGNHTINCHGYACLLSGIPGWPANAWIDSIPTEYNDNINGLRNLLDEYFFDTQIRYSPNNSDSFETDDLLQSGDYVAMYRRGDMVHSGIVVQGQDSYGIYNVIESKLEEDEVVQTPLTNLIRPYGITEVRIFRRK